MSGLPTKKNTPPVFTHPLNDDKIATYVRQMGAVTDALDKILKAIDRAAGQNQRDLERLVVEDASSITTQGGPVTFKAQTRDVELIENIWLVPAPGTTGYYTLTFGDPLNPERVLILPNSGWNGPFKLPVLSPERQLTWDNTNATGPAHIILFGQTYPKDGTTV